MKYILVLVAGRDITVTKHLSYSGAFNKIKTDLAELLGMDMDAIDEVISLRNGEGCDFTIGKDWAFAKVRDEDEYDEYNWSIYELSKIPQG